MPLWQEFNCYWLGTQIQRSRIWKIWYALKAYFIAFCIIWKYDVVHFHTVPDTSMKVQLPVFILARLYRKKIIMHLHVGNQLSMEKYINNRLAHWCMRKSNFLVLLGHQCEFSLNKYWKDVRVPRQVIYNACDEARSLPYKSHDKTILFVGRFTKNKAGDILIRAFAKVHKNYPGWRVCMLAEGPEREYCQNLAKGLGVENEIEMLGFLYGEEKSRYFQKAGIFCLCSYYEGFPMVVLEAWSYGVPVIATPAGGLVDVMEEGKTGLTYDFGDVDGLAQKLGMLMGEEELREKISIYSQNYVRQKFSIEEIGRQWQHLYRNL